MSTAHGREAEPRTGAVEEFRELYGCYAFGITLEKVDLDLRGAHHDIRLSRALRLDSLRINSFGIELSR